VGAGFVLRPRAGRSFLRWWRRLRPLRPARPAVVLISALTVFSVAHRLSPYRVTRTRRAASARTSLDPPHDLRIGERSSNPYVGECIINAVGRRTRLAGQLVPALQLNHPLHPTYFID